MSKVYMITVDELKFEQTDPATWIGSDIFYVRAENADAAKEHLQERIRKYYFKAKLSNKADDINDPKRLGDDIIVEEYITELTGTAPLDAVDVTAMAYMWCETKVKHWEDWNITVEDACA